MAIITLNNNSLSSVTSLPAADGSSLTGIPTDAVQVASASGGGTTVQDFNSCFSSTYKFYLILANIKMSSDSNVSIRFQNASNTELSSGVYYYQGGGRHGAAGTYSSMTLGGFGENRIDVRENIQGNNPFGFYELLIGDPFSNTKTNYHLRYHCQDAASSLRTVYLAGVYDTNVSMAGIRFNSSSGNINSASTFKIYGLK
jgi:hypothetical protein